MREFIVHTAKGTITIVGLLAASLIPVVAAMQLALQ